MILKKIDGLQAIGHLHVNPEADRIGIDTCQHGASVWPDVYSVEKLVAEENHINTPDISLLENE